MKKNIKMIFLVALIFFVFWIALASLVPVRKPAAYGATFSAFYAERFGLDWQKVFIAVLNDLKIRSIRLPAYWNEIEPEENIFDFSRLDWQINEAEKRNVGVVLAVGRKLPRWPECHIPAWAAGLSLADQDGQLLKYIETVVNRYKSSAAVKIWQVENEPFLPFGECPDFSAELLDREIALVRSLDDRPVMVTDSGELSIWLRAAKRSDIFGSTMYRTIWNERLGTFTYPLPPSFFRVKRALTELVIGKKPMVIIELQGETWAKKMTYELTVEEQYISMNPEAFKKILDYASRSGFDTFYLWGVEWWYWLKENQNKPEMWDIAKEAVNSVK